MPIIPADCIMTPSCGRLSGPGLYGTSALLGRKEHKDAGTDRIEAAGSSGAAGSFAEGSGAARGRITLDRDLPGVRQASSLHADRDEDRQGIRRAPRGVGGGGVASRTFPGSLRFSALPRRDPLRELPLYGVLGNSPSEVATCHTS